MRPEGWERRLHDLIKAASGRPFSWDGPERWDCCLFVAACVEAMTGRDFAAPYRGTYDSAAGAARRMIEVAGGGVEAVATHALGVPLDHPNFAQRGDVVSVETPDGLALGINAGNRIYVAGHDGLVALPVTAALKAWRV